MPEQAAKEEGTKNAASTADMTKRKGQQQNSVTVGATLDQWITWIKRKNSLLLAVVVFLALAQIYYVLTLNVLILLVPNASLSILAGVLRYLLVAVFLLTACAFFPGMGNDGIIRMMCYGAFALAGLLLVVISIWLSVDRSTSTLSIPWYVAAVLPGKSTLWAIWGNFLLIVGIGAVVLALLRWAWGTASEAENMAEGTPSKQVNTLEKEGLHDERVLAFQVFAYGIGFTVLYVFLLLTEYTLIPFLVSPLNTGNGSPAIFFSWWIMSVSGLVMTASLIGISTDAQMILFGKQVIGNPNQSKYPLAIFTISFYLSTLTQIGSTIALLVSISSSSSLQSYLAQGGSKNGGLSYETILIVLSISLMIGVIFLFFGFWVHRDALSNMAQTVVDASNSLVDYNTLATLASP